MSDENLNVVIGDSELSLADIAGVDMSEVAEYRLVVTPAGKWHFRIMDMKLGTMEATNKEDPSGPKINKAVVQTECEAQNCLALIDDTLDPANFVGRKHNETFWLNDLAMDLGRVKAFLVDIGLDGNKPFQELLDEAHGMEFVCDITNVKDKNDPDRVYANMKKPMSIEAYNESVNANS